MSLLTAFSQTGKTVFPAYSSLQVREALLNKKEIALLDVREEYLFAEEHPLFAANLPLPAIGREAALRIPRLNTLIVLYGDQEYDPLKAAQQLALLGYTHVHLLEGGLRGWRDSGGVIFRDVNTPSKAFGELVEARLHTPMLSAEEVQSMIRAGENMVILDARRFDEYHTMNIPGSISVPGAELVLRAQGIAPDPNTKIIVNCAGRTRSIIGTQSLINAGIPNQVVALRNGTIGWTLAGQSLEHGAGRVFPDNLPYDHSAAARSASLRLAETAGVKRVSVDALPGLLEEKERTTYCFDVRTPAEFDSGHIGIFRSVPGGQLVQETDHAAPVRGARIVLTDDSSNVRANMTGSWLAQMGWDVWILDKGNHAWTESGRPLQKGNHTEAIRLSPPASRYKRPYEGTGNSVEAMQNYLEWEYGLVQQLKEDGTHGFFVLEP